MIFNPPAPACLPDLHLKGEIDPTGATSAEISVADRLRCPSCETVIRAIDAEMLAPWGFRIACRNCSRDIVGCEPAR
jgi:hypothetical protein